MSSQPKRFTKRRWRRPERMTLDHGPVARRKDLGVSEPVALESSLARKASRRQIQILLIAFAGACFVQGALIGFIAGHPFIGSVAGLGYGAVYFFLAREFGDQWIRRALGAEPDGGPRVSRLVAAESEAAQIPMPRVLVVGDENPNAVSFALRRRWIVTTSGCEKMDELELEGLIAHEIIHLRDGDSTVASLFCVLAGAPDLFFRRGGPRLLISIPLWPACLVVRLLRPVVNTKDREHRADVAGALLTRYPPGVVSALRTSGGDSGGLRFYDPYWFVSRASSGRSVANERAELIAEM